MAPHTFLKNHCKRRISPESASINLLIGAVSFCANNKKGQPFCTMFITKVGPSVINHHMTRRIINWSAMVRLDYDICLMNMTNVVSFQVQFSRCPHFVKVVILVYPNEAV